MEGGVGLVLAFGTGWVVKLKWLSSLFGSDDRVERRVSSEVHAWLKLTKRANRWNTGLQEQWLTVGVTLVSIGCNQTETVGVDVGGGLPRLRLSKTRLV